MKAKNITEKEWLQQLTTAPATASKDEMVAPAAAAAAHKQPKEKKRKKARGFNDVAGMETLKQLVREGFINVLNNKACAEAFGIRPPSLLFYGPAGCGKTFFAEKIAEEVGVNFMKVVPDDLASTLVHGTQEKIGEVFREAERKAPTIIFFDEFDAMVPRRTNDERNYQNGETNEFLCMLNNAAERGIYVLAATNHPERIDKAVLRTGRIDELIYVDMPDAEARQSLFRIELSRLPTAADIDCARLAELTEGYNCSDISYIVRTASRRMFNASISHADEPYELITQALIEETIAKKAPSVSSHDLREFERLRREFSPKDTAAQQPAIGFHA